MKLLEGRVALITGAGGGIGGAALDVFAREGASLVAVDLPDRGCEERVAELSRAGAPIAFAPADVSSRKEVANAVRVALDAFGTLDCAFNNAGVTGSLHSIVDYSDEEFERVLAVNVRGTWYCMQEELAAMRGGAAIVNVSSAVGQVGAAGMPAYTASKHAVVGMTKAAALDHATAGIRINAILPGTIDTGMPEQLMASAGGKEALLASMPIGRLGEPTEIAEAAAWLCSERASLVTGASFAVDGGYLAH